MSRGAPWLLYIGWYSVYVHVVHVDVLSLFQYHLVHSVHQDSIHLHAWEHHHAMLYIYMYIAYIYWYSVAYNSLEILPVLLLQCWINHYRLRRRLLLSWRLYVIHHCGVQNIYTPTLQKNCAHCKSLTSVVSAPLLPTVYEHQQSKWLTTHLYCVLPTPGIPEDLDFFPVAPLPLLGACTYMYVYIHWYIYIYTRGIGAHNPCSRLQRW